MQGRGSMAVFKKYLFGCIRLAVALEIFAASCRIFHLSMQTLELREHSVSLAVAHRFSSCWEQA